MIVTTQEQSAELIKAGLNPDTADMHYGYTLNNDGEQPVLLGPCNFEYDYQAWSMGALWEILHERKCTYDFTTECDATSTMERLVDAVKKALKR